MHELCNLPVRRNANSFSIRLCSMQHLVFSWHLLPEMKRMACVRNTQCFCATLRGVMATRHHRCPHYNEQWHFHFSTRKCPLVASKELVRLESGKMIGRSVCRAMVLTIGSVNAPVTPDMPINIVGRAWRTTSARSNPFGPALPALQFLTSEAGRA